MLTEITSQDGSNNKCRGSANSIDSVGAGSSRFATASSVPDKSCMQVLISSPAAVEDDPGSTSLLHRPADPRLFRTVSPPCAVARPLPGPCDHS